MGYYALKMGQSLSGCFYVIFYFRLTGDYRIVPHPYMQEAIIPHQKENHGHRFLREIFSNCILICPE
jgi:hypothetical protein